MPRTAALLFVFMLGPGWEICRAQEDDIQLWSSFLFDLYQKDKFDLNFYIEGRFDDDVTRALGYFFGPIARFKLDNNFSVGGAVKTIHFKSADRFARIFRYEGEVFYNYQVTDKLRFRSRIRFEYFDRDGRMDTRRLRGRLRFNLSEPRSETIRGYFSGIEYFYDANSGEKQLYRAVPFGLSLALPKKRSLNLYYLLEHNFRSGVDNHALGTALVF